MQRNTDISGFMNTLRGSLMPLCEKEPNPELWFVYNEMQKWEMLIARKVPVKSADEPVRTARVILLHLGRLSDRKLADAIEQVLMRHTPQAFAAVH